jgi:hypothetical protein
MLSTTTSRFNVNFADSAVQIQRGRRYTPIGVEMAGHTQRRGINIPTTRPVMLDGMPADLRLYIINGSYFVDLNEASEIFNFRINWHGGRRALNISAVELHLNFMPDYTLPPVVDWGQMGSGIVPG